MRAQRNGDPNSVTALVRFRVPPAPAGHQRRQPAAGAGPVHLARALPGHARRGGAQRTHHLPAAVAQRIIGADGLPDGAAERRRAARGHQEAPAEDIDAQEVHFVVGRQRWRRVLLLRHPQSVVPQELRYREDLRLPGLHLRVNPRHPPSFFFVLEIVNIV